MFAPVKITFNLSSPVIPPNGGLLHLDGLVGYAVVTAALNEATASDHHIRMLQEGMVEYLDTEQRDGNRVFKASALMYEGQDAGYAGTSVMMTRRTDMEGIAMAVHAFNQKYAEMSDSDGEIHHDAPMICSFKKVKGILTTPIEYRADQVNLNSGPLRNYLMFFPSMLSKKAVAYAVGDKAKLKSLLERHIKNIGRKGSCGFGIVDSVEIEDCPEAEVMWKKRNLPWKEEGYVPVEGTFKPPYWDKAERKIVFSPCESGF